MTDNIAACSSIIGGELDIKAYMSDFEEGIIQASKKSFPHVRYRKGCYFHFLQALSRKMQAIGMTQEYTFQNVKKLGLLSVIPKDDIAIKGIPYLRKTLEFGLKKSDKNMWNEFWEYFNRQWMKSHLVNMWNYHDDDDWKCEM